MDHEEEFLNTFFTQVAQLCSDKAKETVVSDQILVIYIEINTRNCIFVSERKCNFNSGERKGIVQAIANGSLGNAPVAFTTDSRSGAFICRFRFSQH